MLVFWKQLKASLGVQTMGSPLTLKLVFINIPIPETFLKAVSNWCNLGLVCLETVWTRAE